MENREERRTHYHDLGVPPGASQKEIEVAFWRFQGKRPPGRADGGLVGRAEAAYIVLSDPEKRKAYNRLVGFEKHPAWQGHSRENAERAFGKCLALMKFRKEKRALFMARRAVMLDPGCALYRSYLGLLLVRTGGCLRRALHHGRLAHGQDPAQRRVALNLAAIYDAAGMSRRALALRRLWRRFPSLDFFQR